MNKTIIITGIVALLLGIVTGFFNVPIIPVILFTIGVVTLLYELGKKILEDSIDETIKVVKVDPSSNKDKVSDKSLNTSEPRYSEPKVTIDHSKRTITVKPSEPGTRSTINSHEDFLKLTTTGKSGKLSEIKKDAVKIKKVIPSKSTGTKQVPKLTDSNKAVKSTVKKKKINKPSTTLGPKPKRKYKKRNPNIKKEK